METKDSEVRLKMEGSPINQSNGALNAAWTRVFVMVNEATRALAPSFGSDEDHVKLESGGFDGESVQDSLGQVNRKKRARVDNEEGSPEVAKLKCRIVTPTLSVDEQSQDGIDSSSRTTRTLRSNRKKKSTQNDGLDLDVQPQTITTRSQTHSIEAKDKSQSTSTTSVLRRSRRKINSALSSVAPVVSDNIPSSGQVPSGMKSRVSRRKSSLNHLMSAESAKGLKLPPKEQPHPELLSPLMSSHTGRAGLRAHIMMLRTECIQRLARPLLSRLMSHQHNRGLFNEPVDTTIILDYLTIVKDPIDLGTIKGRLLSFEYEQLEPFIGDVRRVFSNALKYNPPNNHVYNAAKLMQEEFEDEIFKLKKKLLRDESKRNEHHCQLCQGHECGLCGEKCLKLEPVMLMCNGPCNQRIKRSGVYYITRDGVRLWCSKCHTGLGSVLPPVTTYCGDVEVNEGDSSPQLLYKRDLLKRVYDEDIPEPWIQCNTCQDWFHQPCALYNRFYEEELLYRHSGDEEDGTHAGKASHHFSCPLCRLGPEASTIPAPWVHRARDTNFRFAHDDISKSSSISSSAATVSSTGNTCTAVSFTLPSSKSDVDLHEEESSLKEGNESPYHSEGGCTSNLDFTTDESWDGSESDSTAAEEVHPEIRWDAPSLPTTHMTNFIEKKVRERLVEMGQAAVASSVHIRLITAMDRCFAVGDSVANHFKLPNGEKLPNTIGYKCKSFAMFQQQDGADICLFCMYVQEYNDSAPLPNRRSVYISYLDSVEYFRPRTNDSSLRTAVYHEIIISYLAWVRQRGFLKAHLWSCPPQRGNNFIFWCHPQHQRTPNKERLILWYQNMVHAARLRGVVTHVNNFYDEYFKPVLGDLVSYTSKKSTIDLDNPDKKLTKKGKRMLNMAKIGRNGRGRGRNGWKGRATWGLDSNTILAAAGLSNNGLGNSGLVLGENVDMLGSDSTLNQFKIETIDESQQDINDDTGSDACHIQFLGDDDADDSTTSRAPTDHSGDDFLLCPPLFEGDYWIDEAYRLYGLKTRKKVSLEDINSSALQIITSFVRSIRQHSLALAFNQPVDPVALNIPDYFDVIKNPMDFNTIAKKLKNQEYNTVALVIQDIDLTLENAQIYNPPKHPVHTAAANLKTYCHREWKMLCDRWRDRHAASQSDDVSLDLNMEPLRTSNDVNGLKFDECLLNGGRRLRSNSSLGASANSSLGQEESTDLEKGDNSDGTKKRGISAVDDVPETTCSAPAHLARSTSIASVASTCSFENDREYTINENARENHCLDDDEYSNSSNASSQSVGGAIATSIDNIVPNDVKHMMKRLQEQHWLMRDVGRSVYKLRGDLLVLHLSPKAAPNLASKQMSKRAWELYIGKDDRVVADLLFNTNPSSNKETKISFNSNDPDVHHVSRPLMDGRHTMLEISMFKHLQFDTLRRAKHATSILLYYLHFPSSSLLARCSRCHKVLEGLRWHCSTCTDYDICGGCNSALNISCPSRHPLTPYHVSSLD